MKPLLLSIFLILCNSLSLAQDTNEELTNKDPLKGLILPHGSFQILFHDSEGKPPYSENCDTIINDSFEHLSDTLLLTGIILDFYNGSCGVFCSGGVVKFKVSNLEEVDTLILIIPCLRIPKEADLNVEFKLKASKFTGTEEECYYHGFDRTCDPGIPVYKISEKYAWPIVKYFAEEQY
ncbi:hypothetical protein [Owenweeksia hongkongensis]|uniref:Uncharacterized protein n=1 Tax=Owenweeksia hongkongensis (strain DSM 17368 / CIP 108786 / JCM 12287 / NRRL B-23963 / UST20020801) TaxID=926562 RepID=G8R4R9_OWEHD|nr:hypothetical protein [Owenweeksia hongkongensis]AEV33193.1 hypothetical protein Oweho_2219 [Owenweeksia hongkongensis DSM 17368]